MLYVHDDLKSHLQAEGDGRRERIVPVGVLRVGASERAALDGQQVLSGDVDAGAGHVELAEQGCRQAIAHLQGAQLEIGAVLNVVGGSAALIGAVHCAQAWNGRARVVGVPCTEQACSLVGSWVGDGPEVGLEFLVVVYILIGHSLPEHGQVEVFVRQSDVEAVGECRHGIVDPGLVVAGDLAVIGQILISQATEAGVGLARFVHLFLGLEQSINNITYDRPVRLTTLYQVFRRSVGVCSRSGGGQVGDASPQASCFL